MDEWHDFVSSCLVERGYVLLYDMYPTEFQFTVSSLNAQAAELA
jgi:hypothetical protein